MNLSLFYFLNNLANKSAWFDALVIFVTNEIWWISVIIFLIIFWKNGYLQKFWQKGILLLISPVMAVGITYFLKYLIQSPRPINILSNINSLVIENGFDSFPSNHTTFMVVLATISFAFGRKIGILFSILALFVAISRIIAGVHFPIDIAGGAFVGIFVGSIAFRLVNDKNSSLLEKSASNV